MPYITQEDRKKLASGDEYASTPGELNYEITMVIQKYLVTNGETYQTYNDIVGALECSKLEIYRRLISAYEDKKIASNGDVY